MVTWETALACPIRPMPALSYLFWGIVAVLMYLAGGFVVNVRRAGGLVAAGGWEALPHIQRCKGRDGDWEALPHIQPLRAAGRQVQSAAASAAGCVWARTPEAMRRVTSAAWASIRGLAAGCSHAGYKTSLILIGERIRAICLKIQTVGYRCSQ